MILIQDSCSINMILLKKAYKFMSVYNNKKEKSMRIFKPMSLEEAKEFYKRLNEECDRLKEKGKSPRDYTVLRIAIDDIWFFTDGLQRDY
jgi:hypothetical protein